LTEKNFISTSLFTTHCSAVTDADADAGDLYDQ